MIKMIFNNPAEGFTIGLDVRTLIMTELEGGEFPTNDTDWKEVIEVTLGFFIFNIIIYV